MKSITTALLATAIFGSATYAEDPSQLPVESPRSVEPELVIPDKIEKVSREDYLKIRREAVDGSSFAKHNAFVYVYENVVELNEFVPEALEFLIAAADAGVPDAQYNLGFLYRSGQWLDRDFDTALYWLEKPAESGHIRAQLWSGVTNLQLYYASGEGPEADRHYSRGTMWLRELLSSSENCDECPFAKASLGRAVLSRSLVDPEGWRLLKESALAGHEGAIRTLKSNEKMLVEFEARGYEHAPELLTDLRSFLDALGESDMGRADSPNR